MNCGFTAIQGPEALITESPDIIREVSRNKLVIFDNNYLRGAHHPCTIDNPMIPGETPERDDSECGWRDFRLSTVLKKT
jgi:hypothetical protein